MDAEKKVAPESEVQERESKRMILEANKASVEKAVEQLKVLEKKSALAKTEKEKNILLNEIELEKEKNTLPTYKEAALEVEAQKQQISIKIDSKSVAETILHHATNYGICSKGK